MPKIVDHDMRKREIGEAVWRVILKRGLDGISVRSVAKEAKISTGALRYYFESQEELLVFSMRLVTERVRERISNIALTNDPLMDIKALLKELLPIGEERMVESEVWLAFLSKALSDNRLRPFLDEMNESLFTFYLMICRQLKEVKPTLYLWDPETEALKLAAFVDGLALHGTLYPERFSHERMEALVHSYLIMFMGEGFEGRRS